MRGEVKHIYFIRHGQTDMNARRVHQGPDEPLNSAGTEGAQSVIALLQDRKIDTLISSNFLRARQTSDIIASTIGLPYSIEPSVREFGRPFSIYGRHHFSWLSVKYFFDLYRHKFDLLWDKDGAENLAHIRERVRDAKRMLEEQSGDKIAVVSHGVFMGFFVETVGYNRPLSLLKFIRGLIGYRQIPNTGIVHLTCTFNEGVDSHTWKLEEVLFPPYNRDSTK